MSAPVLRVVEQLQRRRPTVAPVLTLLRGSVLVTETAATEGLPAPVAVYIDDHAVQITLDTEDALNAWAIWLSVEVEPFEIGDGAVLYYSARTSVFEVPVVVTFSEAV